MTMDQAFIQTIEQAGLTPPAVIPPGKLIRFPGIGKSNGNTSGWLKLFDDGQAGVFGDWSTGLSEIWHAHHDKAMTATERAAHARRVAELQRIRQEEEKKAHAAAAKQAQAIWKTAQKAGDLMTNIWTKEETDERHAYLKRKQVRPHGLRVDAQNHLIVPVMIDNTIVSLQFISEDGTKKFLPGGAVKGGAFTFGDLTESTTMLICEGYSTGASLDEATGYPTVCAFSSGNILPVAQALNAKHPGVKFIFCGDHDLSGTGQRAAREAAGAIGGLVVIPEEPGMDFNDLMQARGPRAVKEAIEAARTPEEGIPTMTTTTADTPEISFLASRPGGLPDMSFRPVRASDLLAEVQEPTEWVLEDFLPMGSLALIAGKPKEGKTTLIYELAVKVAQGRTFLGRTTRKGGVLILAVEEHQRDVKMRLQNLGPEGLNDLYLHVGALSPTPTFFTHLSTFIQGHDIRLVIIDTLAAFWSVDNENDASEMTKAVKPLLRLARESEACILLIHHARKSEGSHGDEIRGSGALFGLVDIAIVMKRHSVETQRLLQTQSRYPETPSELVLELRESGYVALGDPAAVGKADKLRRLRAALTENPEETEALAKKAGLSRRDATRLLDFLWKNEEVIRDGKGKRNDPHRFRRIVSGNPPIPRDASKQETLDSYLAPPYASVSPARNETRGNEVLDEG